MKLLPAMLFVMLMFLSGALFLALRKVSRNPGSTSGQFKRPATFMAAIMLFSLFGLLFTFLGKIALLIALVTLALFFLSPKNR